MNKIIKLEYDENQFIDIEIRQDRNTDGGLGGLNTIFEVGKKTFDNSVKALVSFLKTTSDKIRNEFPCNNVDEFSITIGASLSSEGNFIIASSTSEVNLALTITFKGEK